MMLRAGKKRAVPASRGFTVLEVMVAVAILGLGLTAILSAQFSAVAGVAHARNLSLAVGLARCKMSEIEEQLQRDGFTELDETASGACCENDDSNISCEWTISKPVFPDPELGKLDLDTDMDLGAMGSLLKGPADGSEGGPTAPPATGDLSQITSALSGGGGDLAGMAAGGMSGLAAMVMGMVYPDLKALFEASTRRASVIVSWQEGSRVYDFEIVQWITQPQPPPPDIDEDDESSGASTSGSSSTGASR